MDSDEKKPCTYNRSYTIHSTPTKKPFFNNNSYSFLQRSDSAKRELSSVEGIKGKVKNLCSIFEAARRDRRSSSSSKTSLSDTTTNNSQLPGTEDRVVIYFTSLRGIRRTFEDCYSVRMILKFFKVFIDERDISMDSNYRKELLSVLGQKNNNVSLPQVFIKGKYVGGADVIKQLNETGQLGKLMKGLPVRSISNNNVWQVCDGCGDVRFVLCGKCSGSKKVFEKDEDLLKRCPDCNENGLIRCPTCCCS